MKLAIDIDGVKTCTKCCTEKPLEEFHRAASTDDGHTYRCKECAREWYLSNREKVLAQRREYWRQPGVKEAHRRRQNEVYYKRYRPRKRAREYGISVEEAERLLAIAACQICKTEQEVLDIDHCHATLRVRGVLCNGCNNGIGRFRDDPDLLRAAADYLEAT